MQPKQTVIVVDVPTSMPANGHQMKKRDLITLPTAQLRISAGNLEIREHEIGFMCMVDNKFLECTISHQVLLDLAGAYGLSHEASAPAAFGELLSPIEQIARRKYEAGRLEENGGLNIGTADLLRYDVARPRR